MALLRTELPRCWKSTSIKLLLLSPEGSRPTGWLIPACGGVGRKAARLVAAAADAAQLTVLPGDGLCARAVLAGAAARAYPAGEGRLEVDVRAELVAVGAGCRRAAVALGVRIPVTF
ncbi:hypothetical protein [Streptomyces sp. PvR034]|uniref:hypothetical protein n=1 Tax=Streptomyces sp. PvR034 TaxID=3156401 RepID=UPI0033934B18